MTRKVDTTGMVPIRDSRFMMGAGSGESFDDEYPRHEVRLTDYYMDRTEFTNADLQRVVKRYARKFDLYSIPCGGGEPSIVDSGNKAAALWRAHKRDVDFEQICGLEVTRSWIEALPQSPEGFNGLSQPLVNVSWDQANWLCQIQGKRLPTEAEWEKAAIGPSKGYNPDIYCGTDGRDCVSEAVWLTISKTADVCSKGEKGWGLCDMHGNVWEWVSDWYDEDYYESSPSMNPMGPENGVDKVLRGGSWYYDRELNWLVLRAAYRDFDSPDTLSTDIGFRCAVSVLRASTELSRMSGVEGSPEDLKR